LLDFVVGFTLPHIAIDGSRIALDHCIEVSHGVVVLPKL
jgi:hypothetical protein